MRYAELGTPRTAKARQRERAPPWAEICGALGSTLRTSGGPIDRRVARLDFVPLGDSRARTHLPVPGLRYRKRNSSMRGISIYWIASAAA